MTASLPPQPPPPRSPLQHGDITRPSTGSTGLMMTSRLRFITRRSQDRRSSPYWEPVSTGLGAYAEVFRVEECVHHDSTLLTETPLARRLVAKIFRDSAPNDFESVYASEVQTLLTLGQHDRVVTFRGAADSVAPTFVCGHIDCGQVFQIARCSQCDQALRNGDANDVILLCAKGHRYQKYNPDHVRILTQKRPCQHLDDCKSINFLFRPYILLEELDLDLRAFNEILTAPPSTKHGPSATAPIFDSRPDTDERRREVLTVRLDTLIGVAEGLAFLHSKGCLHADIAPDNAMLRFSQPLEERGSQLVSATTKLIDFGLAKRVADNRTTTTLVGRITFLAPEQMVTQGALGPRVQIRFRNGTPCEGDVCQLRTMNGDELPFERRDFVRDVEDGQYEILAESEVPGEIGSMFDAATVDGKGHAGKSTYARVLKPPQTGRDSAQTTLRFSYALDLPTDIFSLGCLILWSMTGGQEDLGTSLKLGGVITVEFAADPATKRLINVRVKKLSDAVQAAKLKTQQIQIMAQMPLPPRELATERVAAAMYWMDAFSFNPAESGHLKHVAIREPASVVEEVADHLVCVAGARRGRRCPRRATPEPMFWDCLAELEE